jgi:predicted dehydrogenase
MGRTYNWAILGCGRIARKFSSDLKLLSNARRYAAASRDLTRAQEYAAEMGFEKAYGSYEELLADPAVDVVYIATPHSHHYQHVMMCLEAGKAVLNEKAFTLTFPEARAMVQKAREKGVFLMEAIWTRFQPSFLKTMEILESGQLGRLKIVRSDFAFNAPKDPERRLYNVALGGGSLLDIGIYPVFAALVTLGRPQKVRALATFADTGTEESITMMFQYPGGELASLYSSLGSYSFITTEYDCERGSIHLSRRWMTPTTVTVWKEGNIEEKYPLEGEGFGYQHEAAHVMACLDAGKTESDLLPLDFTLMMMETLDRIRFESGIFFPGRDPGL